MPILRKLRQDLQGFIHGRDHAILAVQAAREHLGYVYSVMGEMEGASPDVLLSFPHAFTSASEYVDCIDERIRASLAEAGVAAPKAPPRGEARPAERLQAALMRARDALPRGGDPPRLVVSLLPLESRDELGYRQMIARLLALPIGAPPWCSRTRILVHDPHGDLADAPLVRRLPLDLGAEAVEEAIAADADDPAAPDPRRAQAILQGATMDLGRRRLDRAAGRFHQLLTMPASASSPVLTAMALHGLGECERLRGRGEAAIGWYERALAPASASGVAMVLLLVARGLAELHLAGQRYTEAAVYFDGIARLAAAVPEPEVEASALEQLARCQERLGERAPAAASYLAAARVARDNDRGELLARLRGELGRLDGGALPGAMRAEIAAFHRGGLG
ncbi:MAG: hypothetical protein R3B09_32575 [Nannocystaceae bacterium]